MLEEKQKRVIKRYRNRKLYDTLDSGYVTLEDIAEYIKSGEDVRVIDNRNGEDLTSVTLAQIILEGERHKKEVLPQSILTQLIRRGGETVLELVNKSLGEGAKKDIVAVKEDVLGYLESFVKRGSISREEGSRLVTNILGFIESKVKPAAQTVQNIPAVQNEIRSLKQKLEEIEKRFTPPETRKQR